MKKRWLVVAVVLSYLLMLFGGAALKPDYSHAHQYISELNATGTPYAHIVGWLGFVPFGLLSAALIFVTAPKAPVRGPSRFGYWLLLAEPIAYVGSAIAPCDIGCPMEGSASQAMHNALGLVTFLATTLGILLISFTPRLSALQSLLWLGLLGAWLLLFALMLDGSMSELRGLLQRASEWMLYGTLCICAWRLLGEGKSRPADPTHVPG